jgi:ABC-2 type transport system permease protein
MAAMQSKMLQVARWEYIEKIKSKAFLISLILMPIIMIGMGVVPSLLMSRPDTESIVIGVIDQSGEIFQQLDKELVEKFKLPNGQPNYILRAISLETKDDISSAKKTADALVVSETIEGYLVIGKSIITDTIVEYRSMNAGNIKITSRLERVIRDIVVGKKLQAKGLDPVLVKELTVPIDMRTIKISKSGKEEEAGFEKVFFTSYIFMMMMFFLIMTSGQLLVRSMLEEKSNRVVEVLMSSSSANDLMGGKIIGLSGLGLTQIAFWAIIGIAVSVKYSVSMIPGLNALLLFVYFILGYILYAAIFVAAGAPVSTEQEAQQISSYLVLILIIPIVFAIMVVQNPNTTLVHVLTYIPLLTPSMMAMRIPIQMPSMLEIMVTMILLALSSVVAIWIAGKIFRTTILSYGKRPGIMELWNLIKKK